MEQSKKEVKNVGKIKSRKTTEIKKMSQKDFGKKLKDRKQVKWIGKQENI